jgi:hypothetical protein
MSRSFARLYVLALLGAAVTLPGCTAGDEGLVVSLQTDFVAGVEIDAARVTLDDASERTVILAPGVGLARPFRLTTYTMVLDGRRDVEVSLVSGGAIVAVRRVSVPFVRSRLVNVVISRTCRGVACDEAETCIAGTCESPRCETGTEPECPRAQCRDATECTSSTACVDPTCVAGICLQVGSDTGCGATQACLPGVGCVTLADRDAGRVDGGALDAGPGMGLVCDPCAASSECLGAMACALIAPSSRACVPTCTLEMPACPRGFTCSDVGAGAFACVPTGGVCCVDEDADGYGAGRGCLGTDCADDDTARNPGHLERCNGVDDDCDRTVDEPPVGCGASSCDPEGAAFTERAGEECREGSCMPGGAASSCGLYTCSGGGDAGDACARSCASVTGDDDRFCVASAHCDAGTCAADASAGAGCDEDTDCATGRCQDGTCCTPGVGACACAGGPTETTCDDAADSDCDGATDCADTDCGGRSCGSGGRACAGGACACPGGDTETRCDDGADDDCDAQIDCADGDCDGRGCGPFGRVCGSGSCACPSGTSERCDDAVDDDCDGQIDCADSSCAGMVCGAGGRTCAGGVCGCAGGATESACGNGADDDCDGASDCADADCAGLGCGGGRTCCPSCVTLPPMYTSFTPQALMCAGVSLGGSTYGGLCAVHVFYTSTCGPAGHVRLVPRLGSRTLEPRGLRLQRVRCGRQLRGEFLHPVPGGRLQRLSRIPCRHALLSRAATARAGLRPRRSPASAARPPRAACAPRRRLRARWARSASSRARDRAVA